jgi:hypothetical protein
MRKRRAIVPWFRQPLPRILLVLCAASGSAQAATVVWGGGDGTFATGATGRLYCFDVISDPAPASL